MSGAAFVIALSPSHGRALCAVRPSTVSVAWIRAHATELEAVVARLEAHGERRVSNVRIALHDDAELVFEKRSFFARVEDERHVEANGARLHVLGELDHHGEPALHVARARAEAPVTVDPRRPVSVRTVSRCPAKNDMIGGSTPDTPRRRFTTLRSVNLRIVRIRTISLVQGKTREFPYRRTAPSLLRRVSTASQMADSSPIGEAIEQSQRSVSSRLIRERRKSRSAWLSESFRSVEAVRWPMMSAHGTPNSPAGNFFVRIPGMTTLRGWDRAAVLHHARSAHVEDRGRRREDDARAEYRFGADVHAFDDDDARSDERAVFDDDGRRRRGLEHAADADTAGQMHVTPDLGARADGGPRVDHRPRADARADVHVARHHDRAALDEGAVTNDARRNDAHARRGEVLLQRYLVVELERATWIVSILRSAK